MYCCVSCVLPHNVNLPSLSFRFSRSSNLVPFPLGLVPLGVKFPKGKWGECVRCKRSLSYLPTHGLVRLCCWASTCPLASESVRRERQLSRSYALVAVLELSTEQHDVKHIVYGGGARWATDYYGYYVVTALCYCYILYAFYNTCILSYSAAQSCRIGPRPSQAKPYMLTLTHNIGAMARLLQNPPFQG